MHLAEQAKNDGYLEGFSKGYEEALAEFKNENTPRAVAIADLLDNILLIDDLADTLPCRYLRLQCLHVVAPRTVCIEPHLIRVGQGIERQKLLEITAYILLEVGCGLRLLCRSFLPLLQARSEEV